MMDNCAPFPLAPDSSLRKQTMSKKILVVEDSPTEQMVVVSTLSKLGYQVLTACDGEEAIQKVTMDQPDLVVLDVVMPKKNGFQVCRQIKTDPTTNHIKVLMVSGKAAESDKFWGLKQGADGYLTKPVDETLFLRSVQELC